MKRFFPLFLFMTSLLFLTGCNTDNLKSDAKEWNNNLEKAQAIEVIPLEESDDPKTITANQEIKDFIESLQIDTWKTSSIPSDANKNKEFKMYQENTVKLGESLEDEQELKEIAVITVYDDVSYIDLSMKNFSLSFEIPKDVTESLIEF